MIAWDRELLARLGRLNTEIGRFTVEMLHQQDDGHLPVDGLRLLSQHLAELAAEMWDRANKLDTHLIEGDATGDEVDRG